MVFGTLSACICLYSQVWGAGTAARPCQARSAQTEPANSKTLPTSNGNPKKRSEIPIYVYIAHPYMGISTGSPDIAAEKDIPRARGRA